jgi:transcription elongation factor GreA
MRGYNDEVSCTLPAMPIQKMPYKEPPKLPLSQKSIDAKKTELARLISLRKEVVKRLTTAREMGDLSENSGYKGAKHELGNIGRQMREINYILKHAYVPVIDEKPIAGFGKTITLQSVSTQPTKTLTFTLVGEYEVDVTENKYSLQSPIGTAVMGKTVGDTVELVSPKGTTVYKLTSCETFYKK